MRRLALGASLAGLVLAASPGAALAGTRTIDFDDATVTCCFIQTQPLTARYAGLGVTFAGPEPGGGGAILDQGGGFGVSGHSAPNFLAFNTGVSYSNGKSASGPRGSRSPRRSTLPRSRRAKGAAGRSLSPRSTARRPCRRASAPPLPRSPP